MKRIPLSFLFFLSLLGLAVGQSGLSHDSYDGLLRKYVDDRGRVDYDGLKEERAVLKNYLSLLSKNPPKATWSEHEKLAFWINAYNAFTLDLILTHHPVESIRDIGPLIRIPFISSAWDINFIQIGDQMYDLNELEHGIIRKQFEEPRIHFALVCAAKSCPKLLKGAYLPEKLESQLTQATVDFLADPTKNEFKSPEEIALSKIFSWYGGDFTSQGSLIGFLNAYGPTSLTEEAKITWKAYDWSLNTQ